MIHKFLVVALVLFSNISCNSEKEKLNLKVATYNIRLDFAGDSVNVWDNRKQNVVSLIKKHNPDIIGLQEAVVHQMKYILSETNYANIGVGRDDGHEAGEFSPILFNKNKFELIQSSTFWLSETPEEPTKGWDACCKRIVSWAKLKSKDKTFYFFNTHFDHLGKIAQQESAKLLLKKVEEIAGNSAVLISGDFNVEPTDDSYKILTDNNNPQHFKDAKKNCNKITESTEKTFRGFAIDDKSELLHIDYFFYKNNVEPKTYLLDESNDGKYYFSDHLPVILEVDVI